MVKESLKKILICILVFIIMFNFMLASVTFADPGAGGTEEAGGFAGGTEDTDKVVQEAEEKHNSRLEDANSGLAGVLFMVLRLGLYIPASILNLETYAVAISAGKADTDPLSTFITPFDIIFNRFVLTDINVFSTDGLDPDGMVATIRESIAMWFAVITAFSVGLLIVILVMLIIKLAIEENIAERKAKIKSALTDWLVSVVLVLFMDLIVIAVIYANNMIVDAIKGVASTDISAAVTAIEDIILSSNTGLLLGIGALITYTGLTVITLIFLVKYIYRFFNVVLLIMIAPLAPVPYSLSKMTNKKTGSSLNTWLYEYVNAVFTQVIHCIIYTCIIGVALEGFAANTEIKGLAALAPTIFAIFAMFFVWPAEKLIRKIFGLKQGAGITQVIHNVANGARDVAGAVQVVQSGGIYRDNSSIVGGLVNNFGTDMSNTNNTNNSNNTNIHTRTSNFGNTFIDQSGNLAPGLEQNGSFVSGTYSEVLPNGDGNGQPPNSYVDSSNYAMLNTMLSGNTDSGFAIGVDNTSQDRLLAAIDSVKANGINNGDKDVVETTATFTDADGNVIQMGTSEFETIETEKTEEVPVVLADGQEISKEKYDSFIMMRDELLEKTNKNLKKQLGVEELDEIKDELDRIKIEIEEAMQNASQEEMMKIIEELTNKYANDSKNSQYTDFVNGYARVVAANNILKTATPQLGPSKPVEEQPLEDGTEGVVTYTVSQVSDEDENIKYMKEFYCLTGFCPA